MKKLYIAYYRDNHEDKKNALVFVADKGREKTEFKKYAKKNWRIKIDNNDISGIHEVKIGEDAGGALYRIGLTQIKKNN
jgi:hypothetical protein